MEMSSFLFLVSCIVLFCGSTEIRPIHMEPRSVSGLGGSHMNVMLGVRNITNTSAILDWIVPDDKPFVGFKISCKGYANNPAPNRFNFDESNDGEAADLVEGKAPRDARQLLINRLTPDYNYSCSLLAAELNVIDPELPHSWTSMIKPIQFLTLSSSPPVDPDGDDSSMRLNLLSFRDKYGKKSALIILAGGLPVAAIIACVGVCVAYRKCDSYRRRKNDNFRNVNEQKLDKKLTNVVYSPIAMEYMTNWDKSHRPKSAAAGPRGGNTGFYSGRHQSPRKTGYTSSGYEKMAVPFGHLSLRDLVQRVELARRESPYYEDFKHNDPILIGTPSTSISSSSISVCSTKESYGADGVINMQPVIPSLKLSTPGFDYSDTDTEQYSRQVKRVGRYSERPNKRAGASTSFFKSRKSGSYTKAVMVQPRAELQNDSILPEFPAV